MTENIGLTVLTAAISGFFAYLGWISLTIPADRFGNAFADCMVFIGMLFVIWK